DVPGLFRSQIGSFGEDLRGQGAEPALPVVECGRRGRTWTAGPGGRERHDVVRAWLGRGQERTQVRPRQELDLAAVTKNRPLDHVPELSAIALGKRLRLQT